MFALLRRLKMDHSKWTVHDAGGVLFPLSQKWERVEKYNVIPKTCFALFFRLVTHCDQSMTSRKNIIKNGAARPPLKGRLAPVLLPEKKKKITRSYVLGIKLVLLPGTNHKSITLF